MDTRPSTARAPGARAPDSTASRALRVLIVVENMSYTYDTRVQKIARTLERAGHRVTVICPRYPGDPLKASHGSISVSFFPMPRLPGGAVGHALEYAYSFAAVSLLSCAAFVKTRFDAIHICNPPDIFFPVGGLYRLLGRRFVFDQHDLCPDLSQVRYGRRRWLYRMALLLERLTYRAADHVLVTSESGRQCAITRGGVRAERLTLVLNGPDLSRLPEAMEADARDLVEVGYVGDMNPQDGIDNLLQAAARIRWTRQRRDVRFVLVGDGSAYPALRDLAARLHLADSVEFTGRLAPREAMQRLAACDLCVIPDPKNEFTDSCVMVKSLEYMALGKPIVAFELNETRTICGEAALYALEGDIDGLAQHILRLADDPALRQRLGEIGRHKIESELAWTYCERELLRAYEGVGCNAS
ncbi:MAG: glycosyltransferase family 4 protein [Burkholderiales bacterium]